MLDVLDWFVAHPRSGLYLRQIDLPGIDTKFVEAHRALLVELLDEVLPPHAIDADAVGALQLERRYGLRERPRLVRFRVLDARRSIGGLSDLSVPFEQLRALAAPADRVFVTENDINGLAFPAVNDAIVIFGLGYGVERLAEIPWTRDRPVHYWGDLDTHGFAILDRLRGALGHVRSLLMDEETLLQCRASWVEERDPTRGPLPNLDEREHALYDDLVHDRLGVRVRLEQERVPFGRLVAALRTL